MMVKINVFWLGLFIQLVFFIHCGQQFQDPLYESIADEKESHHLNEVELEKILSEYDKDGDGELSAKELEQYFHDALAMLQDEDGENKQQRKQTKASAKKRNVRYKKPEQQTEPLKDSRYQWSMTHIAGAILGMICFIVVCVVVLKRRNGRTHGVNVHMEDVRAARLRKLAAQQSNTKDENSTAAILKSEPSLLRDDKVISVNKQTIRRRLYDKSGKSKSNFNEVGTKNRPPTTGLLNTNMDRTEAHHQAQQISSDSSFASVGTISHEEAASSESFPIVSTGAAAVTSDQRSLAKNDGIAKEAGDQE